MVFLLSTLLLGAVFNHLSLNLDNPDDDYRARVLVRNELNN